MIQDVTLGTHKRMPSTSGCSCPACNEAILFIKRSINVGVERGVATRGTQAYDDSYCDKFV